MITNKTKPLTNFAIIFAIVFICCKTNAQNQYKLDTIAINGLCKETKDSIFSKPEVAMAMANRVLDLSTKVNYARGIATGYNLLGSVHQRNNNFTTAINFFLRSINIARTNNLQTELSNTLNNLSGLYASIGNYEKSMLYVNEALIIKTKLADSAGIARSYKLISECMLYQNNIDKANQYIEKSIGLYRKLSNTKNLGNALSSYGVILIEQKKYSKALNVLRESNNLFTIKNAQDKLANINTNLGLCFDYLGQKDSAKYYYYAGLQYANNNKQQDVACILHNNLGELFYQEKNYAIAEEKYLKSLDMAEQISSLEDIRNAQKNLALLFEKKGNFAKALFYNKEFEATTDSLRSEQKLKYFEELSIKFETKEIDEKNKYLQSENTIVKLKNKQKNYLLCALLISTSAIIAFVIIYFKRKKAENTNRQNALQQKLLLSQMNPHFIFNSIDNIQSLIYNNQKEESIIYLSKFSKLTRQILENASENYILLSEEIEMLENYISIQKLLLNNNFTHSIIAKNIDTESILVPPMLAQPFIENAIKHGLKNTKTNGEIIVQFYILNNILHFEVTDNGQGLTTGAKEPAHKSMAQSIVKERLQQKAETIFTKNIIDAQQNVIGAISTFEMPYIYNN